MANTLATSRGPLDHSGWVAFTQTSVVFGRLGKPGIAVGVVLALCSLEIAGPVERDA